MYLSDTNKILNKRCKTIDLGVEYIWNKRFVINS